MVSSSEFSVAGDEDLESKLFPEGRGPTTRFLVIQGADNRAEVELSLVVKVAEKSPFSPRFTFLLDTEALEIISYKEHLGLLEF
jgi:hypothetical protein